MFESIDSLVRASKGEGVVASRRILTVPNVISLARLLLIPAYVWLISNDGTEGWGIGLLVVVVASDWVDGYIARRTKSVSELGRLLDPLSDRLVIAAALITFVVRGVVPLWAAAIIVGRDAVVLGAGILAVSIGRGGIPVRWLGKVATFDLMVGIPLIAWGGFGLPLPVATSAVGWSMFAVGALLYYLTAAQYLMDLARLLKRPGDRA